MLKIGENNEIYLTRGDTATLSLTVTDSEGNIYVPGENDRFLFRVKKDFDNADPVINKEFNNLELSLTPNDTKNLNFGVYKYDITLVNNNITDTFILSTFEIGEGSNE